MSSHATRIALAFAVIYLVWGSTYLAIRIMVLELPPFLAAGVRFIIAGLLVLAYAYWRGLKLPTTKSDWYKCAVVGILLLVGGNGLVSWSEQWVESNQAALIIATTALWFAGLGTLGSSGDRLGWWALLGLLAGFIGVGLLVSDGLELERAPWYAYAGLLLAAFVWALGSVYSKRRPAAVAPLISATVQMLVAGVVMTLIGLANGELARWNWEPRGLWALAYLIVFGSCLAYAVFFWLVHEVTPAQLGTYAYVNPAVAVLLGWWFLDERLSGLQMLGTAVILASVVLVTLYSAVRSSRP